MRTPWPPLAHLQDRLLRVLGSEVEARPGLVEGMLRRDVREATSYWLQLGVSIGIATLGLVVGSTAVVIGAMLVAPLMGPIVGLAMGLATGSPFLVLRSSGRIGLSMIVAAGGAAVITLLLPFHELNAEIVARTSPTVLDLLTAAFCALAGVYASLRPGSDTAVTAAGTSIGISLVPPLCASGYGLGTSAWPVAGGAALLFLTNLVAIVVVGTVAFIGCGFNRVDVAEIERDELERQGLGAPVARALALRLSRLFASRGGPALRLLMPFTLLAVLYVPLRRALDEVAWQVRTRAAVRTAISAESLRVVQSRVRVEHHEIDVGVVVLGTSVEAENARARIDAQVRRASGVTPRVEVVAVPDASALAGLESTLRAPHLIAKPTPPPLTHDEQLDGSRARLRDAITAFWPHATAGDPLEIAVSVGVDAPLVVRVVHIGGALGASAVETMDHALSAKVGRATRIVDVPVPAVVLTREGGDLAFVGAVLGALQATSGVHGVFVCVRRPAEPSKGRPSRAEEELGRAMADALRDRASVKVTEGPWAVSFVKGDCG